MHFERFLCLGKDSVPLTPPIPSGVKLGSNKGGSAPNSSRSKQSDIGILLQTGKAVPVAEPVKIKSKRPLFPEDDTDLPNDDNKEEDELGSNLLTQDSTVFIPSTQASNATEIVAPKSPADDNEDGAEEVDKPHL